MEQFSPPQHIALILDGNRRWATNKGLPKMMGHMEGSKNVKRIVQAALDAGVPYITMYILSTENIKNRSEEELNYLFSLFEKIVDYLEDFLKQDVRLRLIGDISKLPDSVQRNMTEVVEQTAQNKTLTLTLAANYGGRDEIVRTIQRMMSDGLTSLEVTEATVQAYLDTKGIPDVDMVIRTGGDQRLSNYLPWQSTYAELYFTQIQWPAFSPNDLNQAIAWFQEQKRNKGK